MCIRDRGTGGRRATTAGAPHEEQGPSGANLAPGAPGDLQGKENVRVDVAAYLLEVELRQRRVVGTWPRDQHMVDRCGKLVEEPREPFEVDGIEGGDARPELDSGTTQALRIARGEDHVGSLGAGAPREPT